MSDISKKIFLSQMMLNASFGVTIVIVMSVFLIKFIIWFMKFLPLNTSKVFFLMMRALLVNGFETKIVSENKSSGFAGAESDDDGYETAGNETPNEFFDADESVYTDSDSDSVGYESADEETLDDFHDPHQYGLWNPVKKTLAFWPEKSLIGRLDRMPYRSP